MFGRRFAYQYQHADAGDGTPPWLARPRFFAMRRGRGPFASGGPFPFGPGGEGTRFLGRGDMKFALLELLRERPMYGYEMIKSLEERSGGFYSPSPGSIYPTLQMLEERAFVTAQDVEGKRVYSITEAGRALLGERQGGAEGLGGPPWMRQRGPGGHRGGPGPEHGQQGFQRAPEMQALMSEAREVMRLLMIAGRLSFQDPTRLARLRAIIERTRKELADMIYATDARPQSGPPSATPGAPPSSRAEDPSVDQG